MLRFFRRLRHRAEVERDLDEEVQSYFDTMVERRMEQGLSREEAVRLTRLEFDGPGQTKEKVREAWAWAAVETAIRDAAYGLRVLRKNPGFALVAILSLALGLGANTAIFTLIDTVMLRSLPVTKPDRLFFIDNSGGKSGGSSGPPYPCYELLRDSNHYFTGMSAFSGDRFKVTVDGSAERMRGQYASGSYFGLLGVRPALGRLLTPADDAVIGRGGAEGGAAVISYGLWERRFGGSPDVLGKAMQVGTSWVTIVGVTEPGFLGLDPGSPVDITIPMVLTTNNLRGRSNWWFSVVGRLKDDAMPEQARAELDRYFHGYMEEIGLKGESKRYFSGITLVPAAKGLEGLRRKFSRPLLIVMTIVGLVLLIGCANVANLLLARASARRGEIAMRLALGASRGRLFRQLLTEGLLIVTASAVLGVLLAKWGVAGLVSLFAGVRGRIILEPHFDWRIIGFTAGAALAACLLFSVAPAWHAVRDNGRSSASRTQSRMGNLLVVIQIMLSAVLLCGAAFFIRSLRNLNELDAGFHRDGVMTMNVEGVFPRTGPPTGDKAADDKAMQELMARRGRQWEELLEPLRSMPLVKAAAVSTLSPLSGRDRGVLMQTGLDDTGANRGIHINQVSDGYFDAFGMQVTAGRLITGSDGAGAPRVAVLNESAAKARFPDGNAVGRRVHFPGQRATSEYEIIGVVRDVRYESLRRPAEPMVYIPIQQAIDPIGSVMVAVRERGDGAGTLALLRQRAAGVIPGGFVANAVTIQQYVEESLIEERLLSILAGLFGGLALVLALIGLYGIMSFTVIRRTREIGIRIAVGAGKGAILWLVLRDSLRLIGAGLALGIPAVWMGSKYVESELYGLKAGDPVTVSGTGLLLLGVALAAGAWPAWRASRVDPLVSLRHE
ncbi:MAG: ABC transporter permease [Acidobacteria bacterium]|nr:ABC transporter permease [Acidobacteriota bacterium]